MNDTLKVAGRIGAELGAAKAEVERLRGLLREACELIQEQDARIEVDMLPAGIVLMSRINAAISQQAEPTDTYTAVEMATAAAQGFRDGQAAAEPAPAQDERDAFEAHMRMGGYGNPEKHQDGSYVSSAMELWWQGWKARAARPAQTEQQGKFRMGDLVKKSTGSEWVGRVVGWYSTEQTKEGYAVESSAHRNSVQIYPVTALEAVDD